MKQSRRQDLPDDLVQMAERLREERPAATPLELDRVKQRVRSRTAGTPVIRPWTKGSILKSRLAITTMLVLGLLMSSTGAALSLSGSSGSGDAAQSQYPTSNPGAVAGRQESGDEDGSANPAQQTRQVAADDGDDRLPFTGLAAIPILLLGLLLMVTGLVVRKGSRLREES